MMGAFWILAFTVALGLILYIGEMRWRRKNRPASPGEPDAAGPDADGSDGAENVDVDPEPEQCCGLHLVCEKDSLSPMSAEILYYDDEELDRFAGKDADGYSPDEIEEIRDVMVTLRPEDVAGWVRSIQLRGIHLPSPLRDELFILLEC